MDSSQSDYTPHLDPSKPFWISEAGEKHAKWSDFRSTDKLPSKVKVAVIGGGLTGISTAYWLTENGINDVMVLETRGIAEGATGRNGGHLWAYTELPTSEEIERFGPQAVYKRHDFQFNTIRLMIETIKKHNIDCDFKWTGAMNIALSELENDGFKSYVRQFDHLGLNKKLSSSNSEEDESFTDTTNRYCDMKEAQSYTKSPNSKGGIYQRFAGQVWPAKFVFGLCEILTSRNVNIQTRTFVNKVVRHWSPIEQYEIQTSRGSFFAEHVVYATNAYTGHLLPELQRTIVPTQGQVLVTSPVNISIPGNTWYDFGYLYMIQRPDGRLVLGGCRNKNPKGDLKNNDDKSLEPIVSEELRKFLKTNFPELETQGIVVEHEWTGIMGFTPDTLPMIGNLRGKEWIAAGYTGYGMPKCFGAAKAIAEMISGKITNKDFVPQYEPSRFWPVSKL